MKSNKVFTLCIIALSSIICFTGYSKTTKITEQEVLLAQKNWGNALIKIGKCYTKGKDYKKAAKNLINDLYAYQSGQVLFKPTKTSDIKFRSTKEGALSYFIGNNKKFPEDKGFALQPWVNVRFKNEGIYINNNTAMAMGKYYFIPLKGKTVAVEYTFGYIKEKDKPLKIVLHHSSLPYSKK